ncbi:MAG: hypothetical protein ABJI69_10070 [Balneola sp.]
MGSFGILQIIAAVIGLALIISWIIMPWKVLGIADDLKENNRHLEDLKKIEFEKLQIMKQQNK